MIDYESFLVFWCVGIMFSVGFCPLNSDCDTWRKYANWIFFISFAWPLAVGIILRQAIQELVGGK